MEALWWSAAYGSSEARERFRIADEKVESGEWIDISPRRRGHRRATNIRALAIIGISLIALVGAILFAVGTKPFAPYVERYLPFTKIQEPAVHPVVAASVATYTPAPTATVIYASTATLVTTQVPVGTATLVPIVSLTHSPTPTPTSIPPTFAPVLVPPTTTPTPMPDKNLLLGTEYNVRGYWSDGTADVELKMSLSNQGSLPFEDRQAITVSCSTAVAPIDGCSANTEISLPDGFAPADTSVVMRIPMGLVTLEIDYGGDTKSLVQLNVPERILGVSRNTWDCYSDRATSYNHEGFHGCYGWHSTTVEKWRTGSTVKVWATGKDAYIRVLKETLDEQFAPVLNITFEWADSRTDADLVAEVGVSKSEARDEWGETCLHSWGCGVVTDAKNGEVREAELLVFHLPIYDRFLNDYENLKRVTNGVFIHEGLHALAPTGHAHPRKVVLSSMHSAGFLTHIDRAILGLNSHLLVKPGMTMREVGALIIFDDELLDTPQAVELNSYEILERTLAELLEVNTVRMKIRGGRSGGGCDQNFGKREWATLQIGDFKKPNDPRMAMLTDGHERFFIFYSDDVQTADGDGWRHYWQRDGGSWKSLSREELWDSTAWFVRNSKLHDGIVHLLWNYDADAIEFVGKTDGVISLSATYNPTEVSPFGWHNESRTFTVNIDEKTFNVLNYEWIHHNHEWHYCNIYTEVGKDIEYGVDIHMPTAATLNFEYALPPAENWAR